MFYTLFTGKKDLPETITKFGHIPLRNYQKIHQCKNNGAFTKSYKGTLKEKLFKEYIDNVEQMMKHTEENQNALIDIIDQLFMFIKDPQDQNKKLIVINPQLDNKLLSKLIIDTRVAILKLYTTCEEDFFKGLQIFETLVSKQIMDTSIAQINRLQQNVEDTISIDPSNEPSLQPPSEQLPIDRPPLERATMDRSLHEPVMPVEQMER